ncbi:MAG: hypothetical protein LC650_00170 [Actinobacteria bacterium]|nr:hypothetical protein [Actinomycetota bacterium]
MKYTNEMRAAVHAVKNPTSIPIDVAQKGDQLFLLFDSNLYERLDKPKRKDFVAYLRYISSIIELGGGGPVFFTRLQEPS